MSCNLVYFVFDLTGNIPIPSQSFLLKCESHCAYGYPYISGMHVFFCGANLSEPIAISGHPSEDLLLEIP
jgi:hypothetical protein